MASPVIVALSNDYIRRLQDHLDARGVNVAIEELEDALLAAARYEDATPQPDLFGSV